MTPQINKSSGIEFLGRPEVLLLISLASYTKGVHLSALSVPIAPELEVVDYLISVIREVADSSQSTAKPY